MTFGIHAQVHGRFTAAVTNRFELDQIVRPAQERFAAFEEFSLKVCAQAVAENGDILDIRRIAELFDLVASEELCFVDQDTVDCLLRMKLANECEQIG